MGWNTYFFKNRHRMIEDSDALFVFSYIAKEGMKLHAQDREFVEWCSHLNEAISLYIPGVVSIDLDKYLNSEAMIAKNLDLLAALVAEINHFPVLVPAEFRNRWLKDLRPQIQFFDCDPQIALDTVAVVRDFLENTEKYPVIPG